MANAITLNSAINARESFQGAFSHMWKIKATITDQDAVAINDTASFSLTVPGVALGDHVISVGINNDLSDGTDQAVVTAIVTAADTVVVRVHADVGEYAADDLNNSVVKILVARPAWA